MYRTLPLLALLTPFVAEAAAPSSIPVTGYLTDSTGAPINDTVTLHLKLYGATGSELWTENQSVVVDSGQFTVYLGDVSELDLGMFRDNGILSLGVAVGTGAEMSPRFDIATAPFAAFSQYCEDAATVGGIDPADILLAGDPVNWLDLVGTPATLLDGDQSATYTNGTGLLLSGTQFSADPTTIDAWAKLAAYDTITELRTQLDSVYVAKQSCTVNQVLMANASGLLVCTDASTLGPNEATVDTYVSNNGYVAASALGTAAYTASTAYATAAQGTKADNALPLAGGTVTGDLFVNGSVGVGVAVPLAKLDVAGGVKIGADLAACTSTKAGTIRWTGTTFQACDGVAWTTFARRQDGSTQAGAGLSCRAILDSGASTGDRLYWIDPNGGATTDAFRAFCDMTTDGGGWTLAAITNGSNNIHTEDAAVGVPFDTSSTGGNIGQANTNALISAGTVARVTTKGVPRYFNAVSGSGWGTYVNRHWSQSTTTANNWLRTCFESYSAGSNTAIGTTHTMGVAHWNSMPGNFDSTNGPDDQNWGYSIAHDYGGTYYGSHRAGWSGSAQLWIK